MYDISFFYTKNGKLAKYYWEAKNPKALVCIVHGIGEYLLSYDKIAESFMEADISVAGFDLKGHGCSPGSRGHIGRRHQVYEDIDSFLYDLKSENPDLPIILYGHSLGGNIVLGYRYNYDKKNNPSGYIVSSPWISLVRPTPKALYFFIKGLAKIKPDMTVNQGIDEGMLGNSQEIKNKKGKILKHGRISVLTAVEAYETAERIIKNNNGSSSLDKDTKMLLMHGSKDQICNVDGTRAFYENNQVDIQYTEWDGYLHELHNGSETRSGLEVIEYTRDWICENFL